MKISITLKSRTIRFFSFILIGVIAASIGIYFRLYTLFTYTSYDASEKATLLVISQLQNSVQKSVEKNYPNLSPVEKKQLFKKQLDALLHNEKDNFNKTIHRVAKELDNNNPAHPKTPYLLASDSFYYYQLTENIVKTGRISPKFHGSKYFNELMLAPEGFWEPLNLHPYVGFIVYKIVALFKPDASLMYGVSFTSLFMMTLCLIPFLFCCTFLGCSLYTCLIGAVYFVLTPIFLKRSMFNWYDNDPYSVFFPLVVLSLVFYGLKSGLGSRQRLLSAGLCCLMMAGYALFWQGWVFLESIVLIAGVPILAYNFLIGQKLKKTSVATISTDPPCVFPSVGNRFLILYFAVIGLGTLAVIGVSFGPKEFFVLFQEGWKALQDFLTPQLTLWPDLYIAVGELRRADLFFIVDLTGGYFVFAVALLGLLGCLCQIMLGLFPNLSRFKITKSMKFIPPFPIFIILIFLIFSLVLTFGAQRFVLLSMTPILLLFCIGVEMLLRCVHYVIGTIKIPRVGSSTGRCVTLFILTIVIVILPLPRTNKMLPALLNQIYNDIWDNSLRKIERETPTDSIINTWWPPGHFIKATAKRRVTFDGATINKPQAYWMAKIFLSQNENEALGLLRMLNGSANQSAEYLVNQGFKLSQAVKILEEITTLNALEAKQRLKNHLNEEQSERLTQLTHAKPAPAYLFIYNELIEKNLLISYVGNWNIEKVEDINANPELRKKVPSRSSKEYVGFIWDIAGGRAKYSNILAPVLTAGDEVLFQDDVRVNIPRKQVIINSSKFGKGIPRSLWYMEDGKMIEKRFPNANLNFSVLLFNHTGIYNCVLLDNELAESLIMRLYAFEGQGFHHLKLFHKEADMTRRTQIWIYEVDWEGFLKEIGEE